MRRTTFIKESSPPIQRTLRLLIQSSVKPTCSLESINRGFMDGNDTGLNGCVAQIGSSGSGTGPKKMQRQGLLKDNKVGQLLA